MPFSSQGLSPSVFPTLPSEPLAALSAALMSLGYSVPTVIQQQAIPAILLGCDVVASAQTGSGKTVAYALPLLAQLMTAPMPPTGALARKRTLGALVLVPTRELAVQVGDTLVHLSRQLPQKPKVAVVFGGVSINPQMMNLRSGAHIVVATPGRLLDLITHNALSLNTVRTLVMDEADKLLDEGFGEELARIVSLLPTQRQNLFFSATFPPAMEALAASMMHEPLRIDVAQVVQAAPDIVQRAIEVDAQRRTQLLRHLVQTEKWTRTLVFVATKHAAEIVADKLRKANIEAEPFHGELSQGKRTQVLMDFKASTVQVVVATDVAARGLDITGLPVVVNYDLPRSAVDYTHRIGRTGRAGESGLAVNFVTADAAAHFRLIEKRHQMTLVREQVAGFEPVETAAVNPTDPDSTGGIKGQRPSKKDKLRATAARALE
ncbi:MAG: DEAD/DEAH box helicase [Polaromonas sp.]|nr:DEAD/DEAH box helicase [Polaromonas sp.]